jgi:7,8-dihydro-6-hydroxymethylpterin-pyrophosphokinase
VDVLLVGDLRVEEPDLEVPHPRLGERGFVLVPLADLAPDLADTLGRPGWREEAAGRVRPTGVLVWGQ